MRRSGRKKFFSKRGISLPRVNRNKKRGRREEGGKKKKVEKSVTKCCSTQTQNTRKSQESGKTRTEKVKLQPSRV
jgi:hypothetical protein